MADGTEPRSGRVVVFVCTGNTCRSPMAEALCKRLLADRLGCVPDDLAGRGWAVTSAGLAATEGMPAAREAVEAARAHGCDLGGHRSKPLDEDLACGADVLVGMTRGHVHALAEVMVSYPVEVRLLSADGDDIGDPIGQPAPAYEACARQMRGCIEAMIDGWIPRA